MALRGCYGLVVENRGFSEEFTDAMNWTIYTCIERVIHNFLYHEAKNLVIRQPEPQQVIANAKEVKYRSRLNGARGMARGYLRRGYLRVRIYGVFQYDQSLHYINNMRDELDTEKVVRRITINNPLFQMRRVVA